MKKILEFLQTASCLFSFEKYTEFVKHKNTAKNEIFKATDRQTFLCFIYSFSCIVPNILYKMLVTGYNFSEIASSFLFLIGLLTFSLKFNEMQNTREVFFLVAQLVDNIVEVPRYDKTLTLYLSSVKISSFLFLISKNFSIAIVLMINIAKLVFFSLKGSHLSHSMEIPFIFLLELITHSLFVYFGQNSCKSQLSSNQDSIKLLENKLSQQLDFMYTLAHEIRNPLNVIQFNISLIEESNRDLELVPKLRNTRSCCEYLIGLLSSVLDISKAENEKIEIIPTECDPHSFFKESWHIFSDLIRSKGLLGILKIDQNVPRSLKIDKKRLMQILFNVISNSIKFTTSGTISVRVHWYEDIDEKNDIPLVAEEGSDTLSSRRKISLSLGHRGEMQSLADSNSDASTMMSQGLTNGSLQVEIDDTGVGMIPKDTANLFGKFYQCKRDQNSAKGSGLGLWITKQICQGMNGDIEVRSQIGKGTTFILKFHINAASYISPFINVRSLSEIKPKFECYDALVDKILVYEEPGLDLDTIEKSMITQKIDHVILTNLKGDFQRSMKLESESKDGVVTLIVDTPWALARNPKIFRELKTIADLRGVKLITMCVVSGHQMIDEVAKKIVGVDFFIKKPIQISLIKNLIGFEKRHKAKPKELVLIADKEEFLREGVRIRALDVGFECLEASNFDEAFFLLKKYSRIIKKIFLDIAPVEKEEYDNLQRIVNFVDHLRNRSLSIVEIKKSQENLTQIAKPSIKFNPS